MYNTHIHTHTHTERASIIHNHKFCQQNAHTKGKVYDSKTVQTQTHNHSIPTQRNEKHFHFQFIIHVVSITHASVSTCLSLTLSSLCQNWALDEAHSTSQLSPVSLCSSPPNALTSWLPGRRRKNARWIFSELACCWSVCVCVCVCVCACVCVCVCVCV